MKFCYYNLKLKEEIIDLYDTVNKCRLCIKNNHLSRRVGRTSLHANSLCYDQNAKKIRLRSFDN